MEAAVRSHSSIHSAFLSKPLPEVPWARTAPIFMSTREHNLKTMSYDLESLCQSLGLEKNLHLPGGVNSQQLPLDNPVLYPEMGLGDKSGKEKTASYSNNNNKNGSAPAEVS